MLIGILGTSIFERIRSTGICSGIDRFTNDSLRTASESKCTENAQTG